MYGKRIHEAPTIWFAKNNGLLRRTFGGWEISGIVTRQSGQTFQYSQVLTQTETALVVIGLAAEFRF